MYTVFAVGGTTESAPGDTRTAPQGMLANVTAALDPAHYECHWVGYPSSFGYPMSEADSMAVGVDTLATAIRHTPNPAVLLGYSQGAQVVRSLLGEMAAGKHPDLEVQSVGLVADPWRPQGVQEGRTLTGHGLGGIGPAWPTSLPVFEIAAATDIITNAPADSPLRPVADALEFFDVTDPIKWMSNVLALGREHGWQTTPDDASPQDVLDAVNGIIGYAVGGCHQQYATASFPGTHRTYCRYLADLITATGATARRTAPRVA